MDNVNQQTHNPAADALILAARKKFERGDTSGAASTVATILDRWPNNPGGNELQAQLLYLKGDMPGAAEFLIRAATNEDGNPELHINCGSILNLLGRYAEAEAALRHAIELNPRLAEAHCALGVALEGQKKFQESYSALNQSLLIRPDYIQAFINLGNLELKMGDPLRAIEHYAAAVRLEPNSAIARTNLGTALRHARAFEEALKQCHEATASDPTYADGWNALGQIQREMTNYSAAIEAFLKAISLKTSFIEAHANLAGTYFQSKQLELSIKAFKNLLDIAPNFAEGHAGLGVVLLALGKIEEAVLSLRQATNIRPLFGQAWSDLTEALGNKLTDDDILLLKKLLLDESIRDEDALGLNFALGSALDRCGKINEAFDCFVAGNKLRKNLLEKQGQKFDPDEYKADISQIINSFSQKTKNAPSIITANSFRPLQIIGMPRSGTTLVEQILSAHQDVCGGGELDLMPKILGEFPNWLDTLDAARYAEIKNTYIAALEELRSNEKIITDKTPFNFLYLGVIEKALPSSLIIYCRRDMRDVAISCFQQDFKSPQPWATDLNSITQYIHMEQRIMLHWKNTLRVPLLEVKYEQLVTNPETEFRKIIDFCDLKWDARCLEFYNSKRMVFTASNRQVRQKLYSHSIGRWKKYKSFFPKLPTNKEIDS